MRVAASETEVGMRALKSSGILGCLVASALVSAVVPKGSAGPAQEPPGAYERALDAALDRARDAARGTGAVLPDHSSWENPWVYRTDHYEVHTTHSRYLAWDIAGGLEVMLERFRAVTGSAYTPVTPFKVFILPDIAAYNDFGENFGAEHSSIYGSFFSTEHPDRPVAAVYDRSHERLRMAVTHSAVHQFIDRAFQRQVPLWIDEGLASYFALQWNYAYGVAEMNRILADSGRPFIPLPKLMNDPITEYTTGNVRFVELGMLFFYLLRFREGTATVYDEYGAELGAPFRDYLAAVLAGSNVSGHPIHLLLTNEAAAVEADFKAFEFPAE
jgi:hypothetical protein